MRRVLDGSAPPGHARFGIATGRVRLVAWLGLGLALVRGLLEQVLGRVVLIARDGSPAVVPGAVPALGVLGDLEDLVQRGSRHGAPGPVVHSDRILPRGLRAALPSDGTLCRTAR